MLSKTVLVSLGSALLFVLVNLPATYKFTNGLIGGLYSNGCPTMMGVLVHGVVFYLLTHFVAMKNYAVGAEEKKKRALTASLIFVLLSSPMAYKFVRSILGSSIASASGCPSQKGLFVHAAVYAAVLSLLMK